MSLPISGYSATLSQRCRHFVKDENDQSFCIIVQHNANYTKNGSAACHFVRYGISVWKVMSFRVNPSTIIAKMS